MKKRGQAAAFIIIGIIILIIIIGIIVVKNDYLSELFDKISTERQTVPQQVRPLQDFLDSCVEQVTKEAISIASLQGGYIDLPRDPIPISDFTPLGTVLEIIPGSDLKTAVWFRERGNGIQELNVPTKKDIQDGISDYVEINFARCVNNLTEFEDKGYLASARGTPNAIVELEDSAVSTTVKFPINVKIADTNFSLT